MLIQCVDKGLFFKTRYFSMLSPVSRIFSSWKQTNAIKETKEIRDK